MKQVWDRIRLPPATEQRLADEARLIRAKKCFPKMAIEEISRGCEIFSLQEDNDQIVNVAMADQKPGSEQCDKVFS